MADERFRKLEQEKEARRQAVAAEAERIKREQAARRAAKREGN